MKTSLLSSLLSLLLAFVVALVAAAFASNLILTHSALVLFLAYVSTSLLLITFKGYSRPRYLALV